MSAPAAAGGGPCISRRWPERRQCPVSPIRHGSEAHPQSGFVCDMVRISKRTAVGTVGRPVRRRLFHVQTTRLPCGRAPCGLLTPFTSARITRAYHAGPALHDRIATTKSTVRTTETTSEPRQPRRLEKRKNIWVHVQDGRCSRGQSRSSGG